MADDLSSDLDRAYDELRSIDSEIANLSGRSQPERALKRRIVVVSNVDSGNSNFERNEKRIVETGHRRIIVTTHNNAASNRKRSRFVSGPAGDYDDFDGGPSIKRRNGGAPISKRTLQSSVVMPTIETKSRDEILSEMKKSAKKEDTARNQRLFSNLIVGTLRQFQKEEGSVKKRVQAQTEKQREIEHRLEQTEKENRERIMKEKKELLDRRHEKEREILRLKRERAITANAEEKEKHFHRLQCFLQTQTKPPIFFLPAKHTLRTLELLKESARKVEGLIAISREKTEAELQRIGRVTSSFPATAADNNVALAVGSVESDVEEEEEELDVGVKSAVVAVQPPSTNDDADDSNTAE